METEPERRSLAEQQRDGDVAIPETVAVKLKKPLVKAAGGGETLARLVFRTPTWSEIKAIRRKGESQNEVAALEQALLLLSEDDLTQPDIDRMAGLDVQRCGEQLAPFLVLEQAT